MAGRRSARNLGKGHGFHQWRDARLSGMVLRLASQQCAARRMDGHGGRGGHLWRDRGDGRHPDGSLDEVRQGPLLHAARSEEHTSELQSLMRTSYAVFCLQKKNRDKVSMTNTNIRYMNY